MSQEWVVDASVAVKLFVPEDLSAVAERLFRQLEEDIPARLYVPDFFYIECTNILWKYVWRFGHPAAKARQDLLDLHGLDLEPIVSSDFLSPSLDLALAQSISAYDACYVALATWLAVPFVTADEKLIRKLKGSGVDVRWLGDLEVGEPSGGEPPAPRVDQS